MENDDFNKIPFGFEQIDQERFNALNEEEREILNGAGRIASSALRTALSENFTVSPKTLSTIENVPFGLEGDSDAMYYDPGTYGIFIGGQSQEYNHLKTISSGETSKSEGEMIIALTVAHEMTHMLFTVHDPSQEIPNYSLSESFSKSYSKEANPQYEAPTMPVALNNKYYSAFVSFEEGLADAIGQASVYQYSRKIKHKDISLKDASKKLEEIAQDAGRGAYATLIGAKILASSNWNKTLSKLLNIREDPEGAYRAFSEQLGENFDAFLSGIRRLYHADIDKEPLTEDEADDLIFDLYDIIEQK